MVGVLDHLVLAAGPEGLDVASEDLSERLGREVVQGGVHPTFGTANAVVPLADGAYLELIAVVDRERAATSPFGSAVAACSVRGGGWVGWSVRVPSYDVLADRAAAAALTLADGERTRPDGTTLRWRTAGMDTLGEHPALPFLISWDVAEDQHPSHAGPGAPRPPRVTALELCGDADRLRARVGGEVAGLALRWVAGPGGLVAVELEIDGQRTRL